MLKKCIVIQGNKRQAAKTRMIIANINVGMMRERPFQSGVIKGGLRKEVGFDLWFSC